MLRADTHSYMCKVEVEKSGPLLSSLSKNRKERVGVRTVGRCDSVVFKVLSLLSGVARNSVVTSGWLFGSLKKGAMQLDLSLTEKWSVSIQILFVVSGALKTLFLGVPKRQNIGKRKRCLETLFAKSPW